MTVVSRFDMGVLTSEISGELDHHSSKKAVDSIIAAANAYIPRDLVLDMSKLSFMDSSGIAMILKLRRHQAETGGRLVVSNVNPQPRKVIEAAGLNNLIEIHSGGEVRT